MAMPDVFRIVAQAALPLEGEVSSIPFIVLGAYLVLLLGLGVLSYLRGKPGEEDYYLAGRNQGWIVTSLTIMATFFSSWALLGAPGKVYTEGLIFALFALNVPLSGACIFLFGRGISRLGRRGGFVTPGDMLADYYGSEVVRVLTALTCILYVVPYVVMQIQAGGLLFDALIDRPLLDSMDNFTLGAISLSLITTLYIMIGGMRSVAWTDVLQGFLLVAGMLLGGYVVVEILGGISSFSQKVTELPEAWLTAPGVTGTWAPLFLLSVCLIGSSGTMVSPAQWMRYYAADSERSLKRSALIFSVVLTACFLFGVMLVGIGGQVLYPCAEDGSIHASLNGKADEILILVLKEQLPIIFPVLGVWLASIMVMAVAAGSMSTADSNLHALSAVLTRDIYDRFIRPSAKPRERTWVGRSIIFGATALSLLLVIGAHSDSDGALATSMAMIVNIGIVAISYSAQLLPVTIDVLYIRRGHRHGAALGMIAGLAYTTYVWLAGPPFAGSSIGSGAGEVEIKLMHGAWGLIANVALFATVSAILRSPPDKAAEVAEVMKS